jgi:signal transduction histidine kinase
VAAWSENGNVKLTVSDTGIGMKPEALHYIFDEFRQADMSSTRKYGGTGLGLAIVKRFINLMGGDIGVESEVGKGSKFTITLPINLKA